MNDAELRCLNEIEWRSHEHRDLTISQSSGSTDSVMKPKVLVVEDDDNVWSQMKWVLTDVRAGFVHAR